MEKEEKILKVIEKIGEEKIKVYEYENGEVRVDREPFHEIVLNIIENKEPDLVIEQETSEYGHFETEVYIFATFAVINRDWKPNPGYRAEIKEIYLLVF